jgi:glycosyltransferase involved in cell wall biosynthesis
MFLQAAGGYFSSANLPHIHRPGGGSRALSLIKTPTPTVRPRAGRARRIAVLAPPWITVPPAAYGGIEAVVALLCDELVARGHEVTLFAAPGSHSRAEVRSPLQDAAPRQIGSALHESDHVAATLDEIDHAAERGEPYDVIHDHSGFTALAMATRIRTPVVHTAHGPIAGETARFYERHGHKARLVAINRVQFAPARGGTRPAAVIPNPIAVDEWPLRNEKEQFLLWVGRMDPTKGAHRAIAVARSCGRPLLLAGPVQDGQEEYFHTHVEPEIDGSQIEFLGEVGGARRKELFARARAFLMPIRWPEPFGMVMIEALACGTPVLAFPEGAASEIVIDGVNGFHAADEQEMGRALARLHTIDPRRCRESVASRYDVTSVARRYEAVYESAIEQAPRPAALRFGHGRRGGERAPARADVRRGAVAVAGA